MENTNVEIIMQDISNMFTISCREKIFKEMEKDKRLNKNSFRNLISYTDRLVRTVPLFKFPHITYIYNEVRTIFDEANVFFNECKFPELIYCLYYSISYRLLERAEFFDLNKQFEEEGKLLEKIKKDSSYKKSLIRQHIRKLLPLAYGKYYEVKIFELLADEGLFPVWNNTKDVNEQYSPFNTPIIDFTSINAWKDFDLYLKNFDAGLDVKAGTIYRLTFPSNIYIFNEGFTKEKFEQYLGYNGKTIKKHAYLALVVPELFREKIYDKDGKEYKSNPYYQQFMSRKSAVYFLDLEEFFKLSEQDRQVIPYNNDSTKFCIPIFINGGKPSYIYTFNEFKEKMFS